MAEKLSVREIQDQLALCAVDHGGTTIAATQFAYAEVQRLIALRHAYRDGALLGDDLSMSHDEFEDHQREEALRRAQEPTDPRDFPHLEADFAREMRRRHDAA